MTRKAGATPNLPDPIRNETEFSPRSESIVQSGFKYSFNNKNSTSPFSSTTKAGVFTPKSLDANSASGVGTESLAKPLGFQGANGGSLSTSNTTSSFAKNQDTASILSPSTSIDGFSQAQLGDEWWKTIYSIPIDKHFGVVDDESDSRGRRGSVEKALEAQFSESTLFIGGAFSEISQRVGARGIKRTIVLPNNGDATVFLPLLNGCFDNVVPEPDIYRQTTEQLLANIHAFFNTKGEGGTVSNLFASVDGAKVEDVLAYRQSSGTPFEYTIPSPVENSLISGYGATNEWYLDNSKESTIKLKDLAKDGSIAISPAVSDGYWLALDIAGGEHTINFGGTLSDDKGIIFDLDITYDILNPMHGSNKSDNLTGTNGNDYLAGGDSNDNITGKKGDDLLIGGNGKDIIDGGIGSDELWGDAGIDTFVFNKGYGKDTIFDFSSGETVQTKIRTFPIKVKDVTLPGGLSAQLDFGGGDVLTFIGVQSSSLAIQSGLISLI